MELTNENYFSDKEYLNNSTLKVYSECSSKALAMAKGEFVQDLSDKEAILVGSYVDSAIEGTLEYFIEKNPQIFVRGKKENGLKKVFEESNLMIEKIKNDKNAQILLKGEKQKIFVGEIEGIKVKCKIDNYNANAKIPYFTDLKTCKDIFETVWNPLLKEKESFIKSRGYLVQLALYREIIRQNTDMLFKGCIVAFDKTENQRGLCIIFTDEDLDLAYSEVLELIRKHKEALKGNHKRCERCDYCNSTRESSLFFNSYEDFMMFIEN